MRRAEGCLECLDGPVAPEDRARSLADIDRLSAWFGGYAVTLGAVRRLLAATPPAGAARVVDVGGGRGGLAIRLVRWARRAGGPVRVLVVDRDADVLALARRAVAAYPEIALVRADATALPLRAGAVDVATCSLTLHHLEPDAAARSLREMADAARLGIVVNDLLRTRLSLALVWLATRLFARHPFSRRDGPLSVRRAHSPAEIRRLAEKAGLQRLDLRRHPFLGRLVATGR